MELGVYHFYQLFMSYLTNGKQYTSLGSNASSMQTVTCGIPQGYIDKINFKMGRHIYAVEGGRGDICASPKERPLPCRASSDSPKVPIKKTSKSKSNEGR